MAARDRSGFLAHSHGLNHLECLLFQWFLAPPTYRCLASGQAEIPMPLLGLIGSHAGSPDDGDHLIEFLSFFLQDLIRLE